MIRHVTLCALFSLSVTACAADQADPGRGDSGGKADSVGTGDPDPEPIGDYLHCWDHTFGYNMVTLTRSDTGTAFVLTGAKVDVAEYAPNDGFWSPAELRFALPSDGCIRSTDDFRLFACGGGEVAATVTSDFGTPIDVVLQYVHVETTLTVRTDAAGEIRDSIEMQVHTQTDTDAGHYTIDFPTFDSACTDEPTE